MLSLADFAAAQDAITTKCNMMRDADSLSMQRMEYLWAGEKGKKQTWDFSSLEALRGDYPVKICVDSTGTIGRYDSNSIRQYRLKSQALHMTHYEDRLELVRYDKAKLAMRYPFQYGDSIAEPFSGEGIYCGDHKVKVEGQVILQVDGAGTLILSERDTLHKALRVCTITTTSMAMDVDSAYIDPDNLKQEVEERYDWYVPGYRYPLYTTSSVQATPISLPLQAAAGPTACCLTNSAIWMMPLTTASERMPAQRKLATPPACPTANRTSPPIRMTSCIIMSTWTDGR